eukprot:15468001-Alexandrium_andersonii.AAC.1
MGRGVRARFWTPRRPRRRQGRGKASTARPATWTSTTPPTIGSTADPTGTSSTSSARSRACRP